MPVVTRVAGRRGVEDEKHIAKGDLAESDQMLIDLEMMLMDAAAAGGEEQATRALC